MQSTYVTVYYYVLIGLDGPNYDRQLWANTSTEARRDELPELLETLKEKERKGIVKYVIVDEPVA